MDYTIEDVGPCKKQVKVEVPFEEIEKEFARVRQTCQQKANVPGFRAGKAPMTVVEQYYGDYIQSEAVKNTVNETYQKVLEEKNIQPIKQVSVEDVDFQNGKHLKYKFEVETAPQFELPKYVSIPLKKKILEVTDEHVESELNYLAERSAFYEPIEGSPAQIGDFAIVDYAINEKETIVDEAKQAWIELKEDFFLPKFCEEIIGMNKGEEKEIKTVLPKDFAKKEFADKKVVIKVKLNELKKKALPEINDDFAKQLGSFTTLEELKNKIREDLAAYFQKMVNTDMVSQLEDYLLKNTKLDVPESMVSSFHNALYEDTVAHLKSSGKATDEIIKEKEKDIKESTHKDAISQVKLLYILSAVGEKEAIDVSEDEINAQIEAMAKKIGKTTAEVSEYLAKKDKWWDFKYRLRNEKLTNFLLEKAKIEEVKSPLDEIAVGKEAK